MLRNVDRTHLGSNIKGRITKLALPAFLRWYLTVQECPLTTVKSYHTIYSNWLKKTIGGPQCQNPDFYFLANKYGGCQFPDLTLLYQECQLQKYHVIKNSRDPKMISLYGRRRETAKSSTSNQWDPVTVLETYELKVPNNIVLPRKRKDWIIKQFRYDQMQTKLAHCHLRPLQSEMNRSVAESPLLDTEFTWLSVINDLSPRTLKFTTNACTNTLPSPDNLKRFNYVRKLPDGRKIVSATCSLCGGNNATLAHVLSFCPYSLRNESNRMKWRHNKVLDKLLLEIIPKIGQRWTTYCDLPQNVHHYTEFPLTDIATEQAPDLIFHDQVTNEVVIGELSCPLESYTDARHADKMQKYERRA